MTPVGTGGYGGTSSPGVWPGVSRDLYIEEGRSLYGCELLFSLQDAARVRESILAGLGVSQCPCAEGDQRCPLLPADLTTILGEATQAASTVASLLLGLLGLLG